MPKKLTILFSKNDFKFQMWSESLKAQEVKSFAPSSGRLILGFGKLIRHGGKKAVIFRYLNDRKSFTQSFFFLISDVLTCILSWIMGIERVWILHNIDHESSANYKRMVLFRRWLVANCVSRILVTDPLLIDDAKAILIKQAKKIDYVTFGNYQVGLIKKSQVTFDNDIDHVNNNYLIYDFDELLSLIAEKKAQYDFVGFCGGRFSKKRTNFYEIPNLIKAAKESDLRLLIVVISNMKRSDNPEIYDFMKASEDVMFFNCLIELDEFALSRVIDFYWSGYNDISIPYTLYTAATVGKPIISVRYGVLLKVVSTYNLGCVVEPSYENLEESLLQSKERSNFEFEKFLDSHSWDKGALKIKNAVFPQ